MADRDDDRDGKRDDGLKPHQVKVRLTITPGDLTIVGRDEVLNLHYERLLVAGDPDNMAALGLTPDGKPDEDGEPAFTDDETPRNTAQTVTPAVQSAAALAPEPADGRAVPEAPQAGQPPAVPAEPGQDDQAQEQRPQAPQGVGIGFGQQ